MFATVAYTISVNLDELKIDEERLQTDEAYLEEIKDKILDLADNAQEADGFEDPIISDADLDILVD
jgi:hypothetical protein